MAGYVIVDIEVLDPVAYEGYKKLAQDSLALYGGEYLVRGGPTETVEGDWSPHRLVILRFATPARAREWLDSPEYAPALEIRRRAARSTMVLAEGN